MRYFYTDPLAAAWMAKHFGMRFTNLKDVIAAVDGDTTLMAMPIFVTDCRLTRRFHIHPDSLHLLEPQVGDIVINDDERPAAVVTMAKARSEYSCVGLIPAIDFVASGAATIIQRNGIAFHWPEREGA